jgi:hypothetical protein
MTTYERRTTWLQLLSLRRSTADLTKFRHGWAELAVRQGTFSWIMIHGPQGFIHAVMYCFFVAASPHRSLIGVNIYNSSYLGTRKVNSHAAFLRVFLLGALYLVRICKIYRGKESSGCDSAKPILHGKEGMSE